MYTQECMTIWSQPGKGGKIGIFFSENLEIWYSCGETGVLTKDMKMEYIKVVVLLKMMLQIIKQLKILVLLLIVIEL